MSFLDNLLPSLSYDGAQGGSLYTKRSQGASSRIQLDKLLHSPSSAYWKTKASIASKKIKKKIILSSYRLNEAECHAECFKLMKKLVLENKFEVYVLNQDKQLVAIDKEKWSDETYVKQFFENAYLVKKELIEEELIRQGKDTGHYAVLDATEMMPLFNSPASTYFVPVEEADQVKPEMLEVIGQRVDLGTIITLRLTVKDTDPSLIKQFLAAYFDVSPQTQSLHLEPETEKLPDLMDLPITKLILGSFAVDSQLKVLPLLPLTLETLEVYKSIIENLPDLQSTRIKKIKLVDCKSLIELPSLPAGIEDIYLSGASFKRLSGLEDTHLKKLAVFKSELTTLTALPLCIEDIEICSTHLTHLPELKDTQLKELTLRLNEKLEKLPPLPASIESLRLKLLNLTELPELKGTRLKVLDLTQLTGLRKVPSLPACIEQLRLKDCDLEGLPEWKHTQLKKLVLSGVMFDSLPNLPSCIEEIDAYPSSKDSVTLPNLSHTQLKVLRGSSFTNWENISTAGVLKEFSVKGSMIDSNIKFLPPSLETVGFSDCTLVGPCNLAHLTKLKEVNFSGCQFTGLPILPAGIESLYLNHTNITDDDLIRLVEQCKNLKVIYLRECLNVSGSVVARLPKHIVIEGEGFNVENDRSPASSSSEEKNSPSSCEKEASKEEMLASTLRPDIETKTEPTKVHKITYGIYKKNNLEPISPNKYRQEIKDCFQMSQEGVLISATETKFSEPEIKAVNWHSEKFQSELNSASQDNYYVKFPVTKSRQWVSLPLLAAKDQITQIQRPKKSELRFNERRNQYEIKLNGAPTIIHYLAAADPELKVTTPETPFLPQQMREQIDQLLCSSVLPGADPSFAELQKDLMALGVQGVQERWNFCKEKLAPYCRLFAHDQDLVSQTASWDPCLRVLLEKKGVCRHRAYTFMLICHYLEIPARLIGNELHAFIEMFDGTQWKKIDLGGAPGLVNSQLEPLVTKKPVADHKASAWDGYFAPDDKQEKKYKTCTEVLSDLSKQPATLLTLKNAQQARSLYLSMAKIASEELFYLESAQDIDENWQAVKVGPQGQLQKKIPGPLYHLIREGGVLMINWERFSEAELASYKTLMDQPPTFLGEPVSNKLRIVNAITPRTQACSAFLSRCKPFTWPESIEFPKVELPFVEQPIPEEKSLSVLDLYGLGDEWQSRLLGEIQCGNSGFVFKFGKLIKALKNKNKKLILVDAPLHDPHFQSFMHQVLVKRQFFVNGTIYEVPNDFTIEFAPAPPMPAPPSQLQELKGGPSEENECFYLNSQTLPLLLKQQVIENNKVISMKGWLRQPTIKKRCLVQTGPLTDGELRQVYAAVEKQKETVAYFNLATTKPEPTRELNCWDSTSAELQTCLIETEDPDFVAQELQKKGGGLKVAIHTQTDASELIETIDFEEKSMSFQQTIGQVTEALQKGETVILHGQLSAHLYQALEPLFSLQPELKLSNNSKPQPMKGKLLLVTAPVSFPLPLANYHQRRVQVSHETLWERYAKKHGSECEKFDNLRLFCQLAAKVEHGQIGTPPLLRMNDKRLLQIRAALATEAKNDNPIKQFFHHDYDKSSENYAYLNVMAKILFGPENQPAGCRKSKQIKFPDHTDHFWRRLNCLNASALKKLLSRDLLAPLNRQALREALSKMELDDIPKKITSRIKIQERVGKHLQDTQAVVLKGPPGSGKTYMAFAYAKEHAKSENIFFGEERVQAWLQSEAKTDNQAVLIIDEANLLAGNFTFLEKLPQLSPHHKVIFTGNPEHYPGRSYHPALQDLPTVYVNKWTREELKAVLLAFLIKDPAFKLERQEAALDHILAVYLALERQLPDDTLSLRDLQAVTFRWLQALKGTTPPLNSAYQACLSEWGNSFQDPIVQKQFRAILTTEFSLTEPPTLGDAGLLEKLSEDYYLSNHHRELLLKINHDFELSEAALSNPTVDNAPLAKRGVLLEGASGFGKSSLMRALLRARQYQEITAKELEDSKEVNLSDRFFQFTLTGTAKDAELLQAAYDKGCKVILDELNLDPSIETLLNDLLTGKSPTNTIPQKGFFVFASQNSVTLAGRKTLSKALKNRFSTLYVNDVTEAGLQEIAGQALPTLTKKEIPEVVAAYRHQARLHPKLVNMRRFFAGLALIRTKLGLNEEKPVQHPNKAKFLQYPNKDFAFQAQPRFDDTPPPDSRGGFFSRPWVKGLLMGLVVAGLTVLALTGIGMAVELVIGISAASFIFSSMAGYQLCKGCASQDTQRAADPERPKATLNVGGSTTVIGRSILPSLSQDLHFTDSTPATAAPTITTNPAFSPKLHLKENPLRASGRSVLIQAQGERVIILQ